MIVSLLKKHNSGGDYAMTKSILSLCDLKGKNQTRLNHLCIYLQLVNLSKYMIYLSKYKKV